MVNKTFFESFLVNCLHFLRTFYLPVGVASLARSFSRIALREPATAAVFPMVALKTRTPSTQQIPLTGHDSSILLSIRPLELRSSVGNVEIGNSIRRNPLIPLKEIIDIPAVSRIIENPVQPIVCRCGTLVLIVVV